MLRGSVHHVSDVGHICFAVRAKSHNGFNFDDYTD